MDPVTGALALQAGSAAAGGMAGFGKAQAEKKQSEINAFIGRTRSIQTSAEAARGLNSELGSMRNVMGANQQAPGVGTFEVMQELREARGRERRVNVSNRNAEAASYRMQGLAAGSRGVSSLIKGGMGGGISLFNLQEYLEKKRSS